jgi:prepilin-type N-terminal cleavage/methylation domain-containing protein/prepilin-type processing-associated H-X9-DG protein
MYHKPRYPKPMKSNRYRPHSGFTLVELLVVIAIIVTLAGVTFFVSRSMLQKAKMTKSLGNMRQVGALVITHTTDNGGKLPALREFNGFDTEQPPNWHWNQQVASLQFSDVSKRTIADDKDWWTTNEPLALNPLMPESMLQTYLPGYAMNLFISERHYQRSNARDWEMILRHQTPLAALQNPERTPLIVPHWNWHTGDLLAGTRLNNIEKSRHFLNDGMMAIVFLDGHVESLRFADSKGNALPVCEYAKRGLHLMPKF